MTENLSHFYQQHCHNIYQHIQSVTLSPHFIQTEKHSSQPGDDHLQNLVQHYLQMLPEPHQQRLHDEYFGVGPLKPLLQDELITEIIINRFDIIWVEKNGHLQPIQDTFCTQHTYDSFLQRLYLELGQEPTLTCPFIDGNWNHLRVHIVGSYTPLNPEVRLTIRKHRRQSWTLADLQHVQWNHTVAELSFLSQLVHDKQNLLIIGPANTGKTSVLKALLHEAPLEERILILEDSKEIDPPSPSSVHLLTRFDARGVLPSILLADLVKQSLRMRPDRLVVGEVRGEEAKDLLLAMATGHTGSFGTLHASDPRQALIRLEMLIQMGAPQWDLLAIRKLILLSLNYLIVCSRRPSGQRKLAGIYKLISLETSGIIIERVHF